MTFNSQLQLITKIDENSMREAKRRWDSIAKPLGSLGKLEDIIIKIAGMKGNAKDLQLGKKALLIFCADHGVVEEGVTQTSSNVTRVVTENFSKGLTCVNNMAKVAITDVYPIDIGLYGKEYATKELSIGQVINRRISDGSHNIAKESAMTKKQCEDAILVGIELVKELKDMGYGIIATGEMGIGNTTPTSALSAVLLGKTVDEVAGKGAGLSTEGFLRKKEVLERIIHRHKKNEFTSPMDILSDIGGYEIAGMVGTFLGGGIHQIPIIIDGVISAVAALIAVYIEPKVKDYILVSHLSMEPAAKFIYEVLNMEPILHGNMRLGEGSGAIAIMPIITMGAAVYENMATFDDIEIESYKDLEDKKPSSL